MLANHNSSFTFRSFVFIHFSALSFSVFRNSFVCHSYENCRVCTNNSQKGTHMNPQTSSSTTGSDSSSLYCQHHTASGRHCRMAVSDSDSGLCSTHAAQYQKEFDLAD